MAGRLSSRPVLPEGKALASLVDKALAVLRAEAPDLRPRDGAGRPGGLLDLPDLPVVILPDLHARPAFLCSVLTWRPPLGLAAHGASGTPCLAELLGRGEAILLSLGDVFHSEGPGAARRWALAEEEYRLGWKGGCPVMDDEMARALACVELILSAKKAFPSAFHYLKGNHDNIANEDGRGDHGFYKYAEEGAMTSSWFAARYGKDLHAAYRALELSLPLAARGARFAASHAEPAFPLGPEDIIGYRDRPEVVEALTWDCQRRGLAGFRGCKPRAASRGPCQRGALVRRAPPCRRGTMPSGRTGSMSQFHNPERRNLVLLLPGKEPGPESAVKCLGARPDGSGAS